MTGDTGNGKKRDTPSLTKNGLSDASTKRDASEMPEQTPEQTPEQKPSAAGSRSSAEALALAEEAEAEAAEAEAMAAAARARARAIRLRRQAAESDRPDNTDQTSDETTETTETTDDEATDQSEPTPARSRRGWLRRPTWQTVVAVVAVLLTCAFVAASGYMTWQHRTAVKEHQRTAEAAAAARQGIVTLMSLDFSKAKEDVQRIIDNSTGQFKDDFQASADDFIKAAEQSKSVANTTVNDTAVESMTDNSAVVLVAATTKVTNTAGANQDPRSWRLSVTMTRDGGQLKMSKVEFVP